MLVTLGGMVMEEKPVAFRNIPLGILVNLEPASNMIEVNAVAVLNAYGPMLVTFAGMVTDVNANTLRNAFCPMLVTVAGIIMEVKLLAPWNA